jgi:RNA polymerase sigma factor (sigma-70 family)
MAVETDKGPTNTPHDDSATRAAEREFERILRRHAPALINYLKLKIPSSVSRSLSPEDILQEVWIAAIDNANTIRNLSDENLAHWLTRVANHTLVDFIRRETSLKRGGGKAAAAPRPDEATSLMNLFSSLVSPDRTTSSLASKGEMVPRVREAIKRLEEPSSQIIWWHHAEDVEVDEIAKRLGLSESSIRGHLFRGKARLAELLGLNPD